jgi:hypothetical protein
MIVHRKVVAAQGGRRDRNQFDRLDDWHTFESRNGQSDLHSIGRSAKGATMRFTRDTSVALTGIRLMRRLSRFSSSNGCGPLWDGSRRRWRGPERAARFNNLPRFMVSLGMADKTGVRTCSIKLSWTLLPISPRVRWHQIACTMTDHNLAIAPRCCDGWPPSRWAPQSLAPP